MPLLVRAMAPKFALFTKESKLPLNKGVKNMFELLQSCAQPSICRYIPIIGIYLAAIADEISRSQTLGYL